MSFVIRPCKLDDFDVITQIYNEAIEFGTASFELELVEKQEMIARHDGLIAQHYPYMVLESTGASGRQVEGYAYVGPYRARPAYRWMVENSIYLAKPARGKGYGKTLLKELISCCEKAGFRQMVAVIGDTGNQASINLHAACGFEMVGTLKHTGWKHEKWIDTVYMQLALGEGGNSPADLQSVPGRMTRIHKSP